MHAASTFLSRWLVLARTVYALSPVPPFHWTFPPNTSHTQTPPQHSQALLAALAPLASAPAAAPLIDRLLHHTLEQAAPPQQQQLLMDLLPHLPAARAAALTSNLLQAVSEGAQGGVLGSVLKGLDARFPQQVCACTAISNSAAHVSVREKLKGAYMCLLQQ